MYIKEKETCPDYISKIDSSCQKQIILLTIPNEEKEDWNYLAIKKLSALLRGITSKHHSGFYCLNCLHSFATKNKLESHEKVCKKKNTFIIVLQTQKNNLLEFNQYIKSNKVPRVIYGGIESLIRKI